MNINNNNYPGPNYDYNKSSIANVVFPSLPNARNIDPLLPQRSLHSIEANGNSLGIKKKQRYQANFNSDFATEQQRFEARIPQKP